MRDSEFKSLTEVIVPLSCRFASEIVHMLTVIVVTLTASERNLTLEMESEDKQDFEDAKAICRICLTQIATFKDIRYEKIEDVNVLDMFNAITDFKVRF